jgi:hypothetical protein
MKKIMAIAVVAVSVSAVWPASGQTSYPNFSDVSRLQINGDAFQNGNKLTLTSALAGQHGSAFSLDRISLASNASFSTFFSFEILNRGGLPGYGINGADGLTFTIQTVASNVGGGGGGIGYDGIDHSAMVEFDTYDNGEAGGSNHVAINTNGVLSDINGSGVATTGLLSPDFDLGDTWYAWVDYNGATQSLDARWSQTSSRPALSMIHAILDLPNILGRPDVFVGFTSGTGAGWGDHNILSWNFLDTFQEGGAPPPSAVPEPTTIVLFGSGLVGIAGFLRRRRSD